MFLQRLPDGQLLIGGIALLGTCDELDIRLIIDIESFELTLSGDDGRVFGRHVEGPVEWDEKGGSFETRSRFVNAVRRKTSSDR